MNTPDTATASQLKGFAKFLSTSASIYLQGRRLCADEITISGETFSVGKGTNLSIHALVNGHGYNLWGLYLCFAAKRAAHRARY